MRGMSGRKENKEFGDSEKDALEFLRPHLDKLTTEQTAGHEGVPALSVLRAGAAQESIGIIVLRGDDLFVRSANRAAIRSLRSLALAVVNDRLPESLLRWVMFQRDPARETVSERLELGFKVEISLVENPATQEVYLLITEQSINRAPSRLEPLGLTVREAEVLHWIAEGKSSGEIASILGVASGTVDKHAERILKKLSVESRVAAVAEVRRWDHGG